MNTLDKLSKDIKSKKKKMSINDIPTPTLEEGPRKTPVSKQKTEAGSQPVQQPLKELRIKRTVYISQSTNHKLDMIYALRIQKGAKSDLSEIVTEAIDAYYATEIWEEERGKK